MQGVRELGPDLGLLVGREDVDDAVHGLGGVLGVERPEDEVPKIPILPCRKSISPLRPETGRGHRYE